ncbi:MAG TPA: hypothetical protein VKE70_12330 [Candidatus Solibacter sp.]|nr:hypothetical protein [Candidatus Solibacter sp.]
MKHQYAWFLPLLLLAGTTTGAAPARMYIANRASQTTELARNLLLQRLEWIAGRSDCRQSFIREMIDLEQVRATAHKVRFYSADGPEGELRFSDVVGKPASPNEQIRALARGLSADAFVLGYQDGGEYIRTREVVLNHGYFWQRDPQDRVWRMTTDEEKQALLLHEILHIVLNRDDDDLTRRGLCPLRLLASCPRASTSAAPTE